MAAMTIDPDKIVETGNKMAWFRNLSFYQVIILIVLCFGMAGTWYSVKWGAEHIADVTIPALVQQMNESHERVDAKWASVVTQLVESNNKKDSVIEQKDKFIQDLVIQRRAEIKAAALNP